jgi:hypothetical protein
MTQPLWVDCRSAADVPPADRLRQLATDERHVVLRLPAEALASPEGPSKASLVGKLASALPDFSVFDSGGSSEEERITVMRVVRAGVVLDSAAEAVAALRLFRRTASQLASRLALHLGVAPDRLLDLGRDRDRGGWWHRVRRAFGLPHRGGRLDRTWGYCFHGRECRFENRATGQVVEVRLSFGSEFGVLDPFFVAQFVKSTPGLERLAGLIRHDYHDAARVLDVLNGAGYLRRTRGQFGEGLVVREEGDVPNIS